MTDTELHELEFLAREATPGPWSCVAGTTDVLGCKPFEAAAIYSGNDNVICLLDNDEDETAPGQTGKDAAYIAAANPKAILDLLIELRITKENISRQRDKIYRLERAAVGRKNDYARLEKEADWLAQTAANDGWHGVRVSSAYMREQARRAVRGMGND